MAARKEQHVASDGAYALDDDVGTHADLGRCFAAGTAVHEQVPVGSLGTNLGGTESFVLSVVPLEQVRVEFGNGLEAGQFASSCRTLQGAREYLGEREVPQPVA